MPAATKNPAKSTQSAPAPAAAPAAAQPAANSQVMSRGLSVYVDISENGNVYIDEELNNRAMPPQEVYDDEIGSLAATIETTDGLLQPIVVYTTLPERKAEHGKDYELNSGFRRCAALKRLADDEIARGGDGVTHWLKEVPAMVREHAPAHQRKISQLIENLQRKDLSEIEIAESIRELKDANIFTQRQIADAIGFPESTLSNYLIINVLCQPVRDMIHKHAASTKKGDGNEEGTLPWSSGRFLAKYVKEKGLPQEQQIELAKIGSTMHVHEFRKKLESLYGSTDQKQDEATATTTEATGTDVQRRPAVAKRANEIKDKYLPYFEEKVKTVERKDKPIWEARRDALLWVLNNEGTQLGADLAPWEEQKKKEAEAAEAGKEEARLKDLWIRHAVSFIRKKLTTVPPIDTPNRDALLAEMNLPKAMELVKADIQRSLAKGKEIGLADNYAFTDEEEKGFAVPNVDEFMKEVSAAWAESQRIQAENKAKREAKAKAEAEKAAAAAGGTADNATAATGQPVAAS